jgi:DNA-binding transcriptional LysR family regulator
MTMDLWQLHIFCKVVELSSFSKAGQAIHLSQPTVSSHIKDLERHFGCALIDRLSRCAVPTKAGDLLYAYATRLLALRDETESIMAEFQGQYKGCLQIGGSTIPGGYLLPKIIGGFNQIYPRIRISLVIGDSKEIVRKVLGGEIEMGFTGARFGEAHLRETALTSDRLKLIVHPQHAWSEKSSVSIEALCQEPMIVREAGSGTLQVLKAALRSKGMNLGEHFRIIAEIGNTVGIIGAVKSGLGVSVFSTMAIEDDLREGRLIALDIQDLNLERQIYIADDERRTLSPLAHAFRHYISHLMEGKPGGAL